MINKLKKNKKGFTLVELVVVIAILGILAAVAVPAYNGYIKKANEAADLTKLNTIETAFGAAYAKVGAGSVAVTLNGTTATVTYTPAAADSGVTEADVSVYMSGTSGITVASATTATFTQSGNWTTATKNGSTWVFTYA